MSRAPGRLRRHTKVVYRPVACVRASPVEVPRRRVCLSYMLISVVPFVFSDDITHIRLLPLSTYANTLFEKEGRILSIVRRNEDP